MLIKSGSILCKTMVDINEAPPHTKSVQHKSHIMKVMFLCALARPRFNNTTRQWFDGLIGIFPVGELNMYQQTRSANHALGDLKWTDFILDREGKKRMMIGLMLPDIKKKMPINNNIAVQQDGAKAHLPVNDPDFKTKVQELYGNEDAVKLYTQPAQSPDLNVNDLGFFASLQSLYYRTSPKNSLELI
jgi:hypothetical protein